MSYIGVLLGWYMSPDEGQEEYEETQAELKKYEDDVSIQFCYLFLAPLHVTCGHSNL